MERTIRDLRSDELKLFGDIVVRLERLDSDVDVRAAIFEDIARLVRAEIGASYVWDTQSHQFSSALLLNMDPANIGNYEKWYQFHDPLTFRMRATRRATLVEEVTPYNELRRTEFYNDFLRRDGLHHGINLFLFDGDRDLGDFRLWRFARSPDFSERETDILNILAPHLKRALIRSGMRFDHLTAREKEVAFLVARGCTDRDIGRLLGIAFSTVRTHLKSAMEKKGCANRAELAASITSRNAAEARIG